MDNRPHSCTKHGIRLVSNDWMNANSTSMLIIIWPKAEREAYTLRYENWIYVNRPTKKAAASTSFSSNSARRRPRSCAANWMRRRISIWNNCIITNEAVWWKLPFLLINCVHWSTLRTHWTSSWCSLPSMVSVNFPIRSYFHFDDDFVFTQTAIQWRVASNVTMMPAFRKCSPTMAMRIVRHLVSVTNHELLSRPPSRCQTIRILWSVHWHRWFSHWSVLDHVFGYAGMLKTVSLLNRRQADAPVQLQVGIVDRIRCAQRHLAVPWKRAPHLKCLPLHHKMRRIHQRRHSRISKRINHLHMIHFSQRKRPTVKCDTLCQNWMHVNACKYRNHKFDHFCTTSVQWSHESSIFARIFDHIFLSHHFTKQWSLFCATIYTNHFLNMRRKKNNPQVLMSFMLALMF